MSQLSCQLPWRSRTAQAVRQWPVGESIVRVIRSFLGQGSPQDQWQRIVMNREVRRLVDAIGPAKLKALEVSGSSWPAQGYFREYTTVSYPEYDVCQGPLEERFDLVIAEQVFEHLMWPYRAARHVHQMLNPGGWFLISTPFLVAIHECPMDCTRWTETGLKYLLAEAGFNLDQVRTGSWGNRACLKANLGRWQIYQHWRHSLRNDPRFPLQVWALARKAA